MKLKLKHLNLSQTMYKKRQKNKNKKKLLLKKLFLNLFKKIKTVIYQQSKKLNRQLLLQLNLKLRKKEILLPSQDYHNNKKFRKKFRKKLRLKFNNQFKLFNKKNILFLKMLNQVMNSKVNK